MSTMQNGRRDGRALPPHELEECRRRVVEAHVRGLSRRQISTLVGLSYSAVGNIIKRYQEMGQRSIATVKRGSKPGIGRILSAEQESRLADLVRGHSPEQLGLKYQVWRCHAVAQLVQREYGIALSQRTVWNYLSRWGVHRQRKAMREASNAEAFSAAMRA